MGEVQSWQARNLQRLIRKVREGTREGAGVAEEGPSDSRTREAPNHTDTRAPRGSDRNGEAALRVRNKDKGNQESRTV